MILAGAAALLLLAVGGIGDQRQPQPRPAQGGSLTIRQQQIIIRVPVAGPAPAAPRPALVQWHEGRGPRCIPAGRIIGATALSQHSFDLIFRDRSRVRARLERRCPALDFYRGFYVNATADGQICAERDSVRSRTGGVCRIDQFRALWASRR